MAEASQAAATTAEAFTPDRVGAFTDVLEAVARRPIRAGQLITAGDVYLRDDWAELLVQLAAFAYIRVSPDCRGYTMWSSGRAGCGYCGWGMSARMADVGERGSARFAQAAIARVGQAIALAVGEVVQALFEAVLSEHIAIVQLTQGSPRPTTARWSGPAPSSRSGESGPFIFRGFPIGVSP
jgi:hypothetical protein